MNGKRPVSRTDICLTDADFWDAGKNIVVVAHEFWTKEGESVCCARKGKEQARGGLYTLKRLARP